MDPPVLSPRLCRSPTQFSFSSGTAFCKGHHRPSFFDFAFLLTRPCGKSCPTVRTLTYNFQQLHNIAQRKLGLTRQSSPTDGLSLGVQFPVTINNAVTHICAHLSSCDDILFLWGCQGQKISSFHSNICRFQRLLPFTSPAVQALSSTWSSAATGIITVFIFPRMIGVKTPEKVTMWENRLFLPLYLKDFWECKETIVIYCANYNIYQRTAQKKVGW